jgi:hypothetical protein
MTEDYDPVVWVSLASVSGLSLISLGQPGLKSGLDEQVYTGGLTAVQQMLGGEIGGDTKRFVGGSHNNKTGRFIVKGKSEYELVGQFLLISPRHITVAPALVDYYEHFVTIFAEETLKTDLVEKAEKQYTAFSITDVLEIFLESIKKARKKVSLSHNDKLFSQYLTESLDKSKDDYEYSKTLVKISNLKGKYSETTPTILSERNELIRAFTNELMEFLASEYPHSLVMYSKAGSVLKEVGKYVTSNLKNFNFQAELKEIIREFEEKNLQEFLEEYSLHEVTKANLRSKLEDEIFKKYLHECPLLYLAQPEIVSFHSEIDSFTARINEQYDLGGTLSRIASDMIDVPIIENLVIPYIRHFCDQFSAGLTPSAWKYMQMVFKLITVETNVEVTDILPKMADQIPPSHFTSIETMITKYKMTKVAPLSFTVKKASDVLPFYRALFSSLSFGINTVISDLAFGESGSENLLTTLAGNLNLMAKHIHQTFALFNIYSYIEKIRSKTSFTFAFPKQTEIVKNISEYNLELDNFSEALIEANINSLSEEEPLIKQELNRISQFLKRNQSEIAKGYKIKIHETNSLIFEFKPLNEAFEVISKIIQESNKILDPIEAEIDKRILAINQHQEGKLKKDDLEKVLKNRDFITKAEKSFNKLMDGMETEISKKYKNTSSIVNKQVKNLRKDINKEYNQAASFLILNRKNLMKADAQLISEPTKIIREVQSSISHSFKESDFLTLSNVGQLYFYAINQSLPNDIQSDISNALISRKKYPLLKESTEKLTKTSTIFKSYSKVLENHSYSLLSALISSSGRIIGKNVLKTNPDVIIMEKGKIPYPTLELGYLTNKNAAESLKALLGPKIIIESEKTSEKIIYWCFAVLPSFGSDFTSLKNLWGSKDWSLRKAVISLSWYSLLAHNEFYMNLLRFSSELYSSKVKRSLDQIFEQIGRGSI